MGLKEYLKRGAYYTLFGIPEYTTDINLHFTEPGNLLAGRNIIVTGGGRGLGFYIAKKAIA